MSSNTPTVHWYSNDAMVVDAMAIDATVDAMVDAMVDAAVHATVDATVDAVADAMVDAMVDDAMADDTMACLLYTSPSPRDQRGSRMPSSA